MEWSVKRRLMYLGLVVLVIIALGGLVWWRVQPPPSCTDGKQNQNELGTDCGGVCTNVCPFEVKPLKEVWSRVFPIGPERFDAATLLRNPNPRHAARRFSYRLRILDGNGVLLTTQEGSAFANPGEDVFLYQNRLAVGKRVPARVIFEFTDEPVWQRINQTPPVLKLSYQSFTDAPTPLLVAEIENQSLVDLRDIQVVAVLSDEGGNALAISSTLVEQLDRGAKREVVFTWPTALAVPPTFFDFYPHLEIPPSV